MLPYRKPGNALLEYGLAGAVVLVASLGVLLALSGDFNAYLTALKSDLTGGSAPAMAFGRLKEFHQRNLIRPVRVSGVSQELVCLESGYCFALPEITDAQAQTSGSNGGELIGGMADVLAQIAYQLQQDPKADQTLANLITALANQGHTVGDRATEFVDTCQRDCKQAEPPLNTLKSSAGAFNGKLSDVLAYLQAHPDALPPALHEVVESESRSILAIADSYGLNKTRTEDQVIEVGGGEYTDRTDRTVNEIGQMLSSGQIQQQTINPNAGGTPSNTRYVDADGREYYYDSSTGTYYNEQTYSEPSTTQVIAGEEKVSMAQTAPQLVHRNANTICRSGGIQPRCLQRIPLTPGQSGQLSPAPRPGNAPASTAG